MPIVLLILAVALLGSACSQPAAPAGPVAAPPLTSGLDPTGFDDQVRAQDDLFAHVNGHWLATTPIPADKPSYGSFYEAYDRTQDQLKVLVESAARNPGSAGSPEQKIGDFFTAFMDEKRADELGITPLRPELAAIDAVRNKTDLAVYFAHQLKLGIGGAPIQGGVEGDAQDPTVSVLYVSQGGLGLPDRDYYVKDDAKLKEYRAKYVAYVGTMLAAAGVPEAAKAAAGVMAIETGLARAHWTNVANRDAVKTYNKVAIDDLAKQFPGLDWAAWVGELGVASAPHVVVAQPSFFAALAKTVAAAPVDHWKAYLKFHAIDRFAPYLSAALVNARFDFRGRTLQGIQDLQPRWRRAIANLDSAAGELLGKLYVEAHFTPAAKARMDTLVANLRTAYGEGIDGLEWMGPETKKEAHAKLAAFRAKVGYPTKWRDYSALDIKNDDLVGNVMRALLADSNFQLAKVGKPIDPEEWGMTPQTINAYYNPIRNEIVFPAAILQAPFFDMGADDALNYGAIGAVIGHEMGHGFDDQGRRYDAKGVLRDWWTAKDAEEFMRRAKGLVAQYNAFEVLPQLRVNGELTLGENIGDLTGLIIAHRAYQKALNGTTAPVMDGLTGDQRFFAGWAQAWRAKYRDDALRQQVLSDVHSPDMVRANGPLPNVPAFYEAFGVKPGDKLYLAPEARVRIW
ncbi:MAG: M13 family metallopeptidase [Acidobacteriota bacterium]